MKSIYGTLSFADPTSQITRLDQCILQYIYSYIICHLTDLMESTSCSWLRVFACYSCRSVLQAEQYYSKAPSSAPLLSIVLAIVPQDKD